MRAISESRTTIATPRMSSSDFNIEHRATLLSYLRERGMIFEGDNPSIRNLEGGVSNRTVLVSCSGRPSFVVKQALSKLRVAVDWYSAPERIHHEALGLQWLQRLAPSGTITPLLFEDRERHVICMAAVSEPHQNWKNALLAGQLDKAHFEQFATLLGAIHRRSFEQRDLVAEVFRQRIFFETLRVEPYYRYSAEQVPESKHFFWDLIEETLGRPLALVHGDYSPKNVLIHDDRLVLLDHEVIHFGDPAFDIGFSLTHFLSKAHHLIPYRAAFLQAARLYVERYLGCLDGVEWRNEVESRGTRHTLACLLARVAGRSPLEYLTPEERVTQGAIAQALMKNPPVVLTDLIDAFGERLHAGS